MLFTDTITIRGGATPQTFDGNGTFRLNEKARVICGISINHSLSIYTADEGYALGVRLSENSAFTGKNPVFVMGNVGFPGPATNNSIKPMPVDKINLNIPVSPNSTVRADLSTLAGATQTGTHDCEITLYYSDSANLNDFWAYFGQNIPCKGGVYAYTTALTTKSETALTGNGSTLNIPAEATEIIGINTLQVPDGAVTPSEEIGGKVRLDLGLQNQGKQEYPSNGGIPNLGTEVEGGSAIRATDNLVTTIISGLPSRELQVSAYVTAKSAITGGADWLINILWR